MNKFMSGNMIRAAASVVAWLSVIIVLAFVALEAYVRWALNQNFTFLGGFELEALTVGSFALVIALLFVSRRD